MSRALPRQRRSDHPDEAAEEATANTPPAPAAQLLQLQRTAGNRAVGNLLRQAPGGLVQRNHKVPEDADTLGEVGPALKDMVVDDATVSISNRKAFFKNERLPPRPGIGVDIRFGGPMAATDKSAEDTLRKGLGSIALIIFGLDGERPRKKGEEDWGNVDPGVPGAPGKPRPPTTDLVHTMDMDLTEQGGQNGHYRFAAVAEKGAPDKPKEVVIVIEFLGAGRKAFDATLDAKRKAALEKRFNSFGFVKKVPKTGGSVLDEPDDTLAFLDEQWAKLLQALELIPDPMLANVSGIVWQRGVRLPDGPKESGHYDTKTKLKKGDKPERTLKLFDDAFKTDDALIRTLAHEVGHAESEKPLEPEGGAALSAGADYAKAVKADGKKSVTDYGTKSMEEHYAESYSMFIAEPASLKVMRPNEFAFFEKQQKDMTKKP